MSSFIKCNVIRPSGIFQAALVPFSKDTLWTLSGIAPDVFMLEQLPLPFPLSEIACPQTHVNTRHVQTYKRTFIRFDLSQTEDSCWEARSQMLRGITVLQFLFCIWNWGGDIRKMTGRREKARCGSDNRIVIKTVCSPVGGHGWEAGVQKEAFQRGVNLDAQNQGTGWLKAKINLLLKKFYAWGMTSHLDLPLRNLWSGHAVRLLSMKPFSIHTHNFSVDAFPRLSILTVLFLPHSIFQHPAHISL